MASANGKLVIDTSGNRLEPTENDEPHLRHLEFSSTTGRRSAAWAQPDTPATRTGPPRSLSYAYASTHSPNNSKKNTRVHENHVLSSAEDGLDSPSKFVNRESGFRGALELPVSPEDRKGKRRESRFLDESWKHPSRWFNESPKEEKTGFDFGAGSGSKETKNNEKTKDKSRPNTGQNTIETIEGSGKEGIAGGVSGSESNNSSPQVPTKPVGWGRLRSLLPVIANQVTSPQTPAHSSVTSYAVNITDELISGGLSVLCLGLWFERDEKDHRRIPVLLHRLRIRISDSLHPLERGKAVFRIECEYANGAARWVIYRQLRDFRSLHRHYAFTNVYTRDVDRLPDFPKTSLPYLKFLTREKGDDVSRTEFAKAQREALENYLISLIRAVMFHPSANRLSGFLEISALSIGLAQSGGAQFKGGYLRVLASGHKGGGYGRRSESWAERKKSRWCAVRESYMVVLVESGELDIWDVFLLDSDFKIERPRRYYRQGFNLLHLDRSATELNKGPDSENETSRPKRNSTSDNHSMMGTFRSKISHIFHREHRSESELNRGNHVARLGDNSSDSDSLSDISVELPSRGPTPMLDPSTHTNAFQGSDGIEQNGIGNDFLRIEEDARKVKKGGGEGTAEGDVSKHTFFIENSQMRLKCFAKNERQMLQFITALQKVAASSSFTGRNRFDSFAPIRLNVAAQWLVDGRDYFWNLSRAILMARETIYIHDWWLSPEIQLRRPNKERYRLDKLLERKAKEGVKIHVILYLEVSNRTTPTDSNYAKQTLLSLHPNIMVQRSPSHFQTGTFYWAHHEKMCVIDQTIAFTGGIDLCFGRWDTAQHALTDDPDPDSDVSEIWVGKDYSNPRVGDFHTLNKPHEDMYDRSKVPRMPWHDVGLQVVGEPARDLARHFVERWNYLLRIKNHSRRMPFLLPPAEFRHGELASLGLTGTCEMQICRSAGPWSMGTPGRVEHSIQNAYLKAIQLSEHFVYIENQFFITSTVVNDAQIENKIGDAIVHRIIRAHRQGTPWKCCVVIPLLPGFSFPVDHSDASAIRIILECQNRSISRGPNSIFARLRKHNIDPDKYISFFSLRNWAKLRGDVLTSEQVYIHGKICIVDDRLVIIGSANINERSMRGDRDSELAAVIRDTDMLDCTMAGKPFRVGRFAHTLRVRLMREHLGIDVDALDEEDLMANEPVEPASDQKVWDPDKEQEYGKDDGNIQLKKTGQQRTALGELLGEVKGITQALHGYQDVSASGLGKVIHGLGLKPKVLEHSTGDASLDAERQTYLRDGTKQPGFTSSMVPTIEERVISKHLPPDEQAEGRPPDIEEEGSETPTTSGFHTNGHDERNLEQARTDDGELFGAPAYAQESRKIDNKPPYAEDAVDDANEEEKGAPTARKHIRRQLNALGSKVWELLTPKPNVSPNDFEDPIADSFWDNVWVASAVHNTQIFRKVFHCIPDDEITTWKQYKEFIVHHERLNKPVEETTEPAASVPSEASPENSAMARNAEAEETLKKSSVTFEEEPVEGTHKARESVDNSTQSNSKRKTSNGTEPFEKWERNEMEKMLQQVCGNLVVFPTRFLEGEDIANNFLFNADRLLPMPIYD